MKQISSFMLAAMLAVSGPIAPLSAEEQDNKVKDAVDLILTLCLAKNESSKFEINGNIDGSISIKKPGISGSGNINVTKHEALGLVAGLNSAISQAAAAQMTETRECMAPYISEILAVILKEKSQISENPSLEQSLQGSSADAASQDGLTMVKENFSTRFCADSLIVKVEQIRKTSDGRPTNYIEISHEYMKKRGDVLKIGEGLNFENGCSVKLVDTIENGEYFALFSSSYPHSAESSWKTTEETVRVNENFSKRFCNDEVMVELSHVRKTSDGRPTEYIQMSYEHMKKNKKVMNIGDTLRIDGKCEITLIDTGADDKYFALFQSQERQR